jgi:hypothetical protein
MFRSTLSLTVFAGLLFGSLPGMAADEPAATPKPGENFVSLQVTGCGDKCPEFEIYIFDTGRAQFRPNNSKNSTNAPFSKSGMGGIYKRVSKYLQDTGALNEPAECADKKADAPYAVVQSSKDSQVQKATWSAGCSNQLEKARSLVKVFVNQTGMWRNINSDSRYWEKYWETWEQKK